MAKPGLNQDFNLVSPQFELRLCRRRYWCILFGQMRTSFPSCRCIIRKRGTLLTARTIGHGLSWSVSRWDQRLDTTWINSWPKKIPCTSLENVYCEGKKQNKRQLTPFIQDPGSMREGNRSFVSDSLVWVHQSENIKEIIDGSGQFQSKMLPVRSTQRLCEHSVSHMALSVTWSKPYWKHMWH